MASGLKPFHLPSPHKESRTQSSPCCFINGATSALSTLYYCAYNVSYWTIVKKMWGNKTNPIKQRKSALSCFRSVCQDYNYKCIHNTKISLKKCKVQWFCDFIFLFCLVHVYKIIPGYISVLLCGSTIFDQNRFGQIWDAVIHCSKRCIPASDMCSCILIGVHNGSVYLQVHHTKKSSAMHRVYLESRIFI